MGSWWELNEMMREMLIGSRSLLAAVEQQCDLSRYPEEGASGT